jgi:iron complex transport system substrate-binding protein
MKNRKLIPVILMLLMLMQVFMLSGCGKTEEDTPTAPETPAAQDKTVVDMAGRTVVLPTEIKTIATFGSIGVINSFVELFGEGDKIMNEMSPSFTKNDKWKYQYVFAPQIAQGPVFENANREILIEEVLAAKPDLSICMTKETADLLEGKGLTVVFLKWSELADVEKCVNLLGQVFGKEDVAADYLKYFEEKVANAEKLTANLGDQEKKKVLYGSVTTYTQPHLIAEWWISAAGGLSVTDNGRDAEKYEYTMEDILAWNPDVMITSDPMADEIKAESRMKDIAAVKDNAIYLVPTVAHVWGNRTPEQPLTIMWAMHKLYPEIMTQDMLSEEIKYFYSHFFKTDLTDQQVAEIIGD